MKKYFYIGEAAKAVNMTCETLRHYDRIGLVKPSKKDEWTNYRYYTEQDIVLLNTVSALQQMDLPLHKIKEVLAYDDLQKIIHFMEEAEKKADEKIASIQYSKSKIKLAKQDYEKKLREHQHTEQAFIKYFPKRVIMLSDTIKEPSLDNLWNYLSHFYDKIEPAHRDRFAFEDSAGIYTAEGFSRMFAVCMQYEETEGLQILPAGKYLCANCTEDNRQSVLQKLLQTAAEQYAASPQFNLQMIVVSGIVQWKYQVQICIEKESS